MDYEGLCFFFLFFSFFFFLSFSTILLRDHVAHLFSLSVTVIVIALRESTDFQKVSRCMW